MNCQETRKIIDQLQIEPAKLSTIEPHLSSCPSCHNYFALLHQAINRPEELLEIEEPASDLSQRIGQFVFAASSRVRSIPLWVKISSAAAAVVLGLFLGSMAYDSRVAAQSQTEYSYINTSDTLYMAETTEIMYYSTLVEEGN